MSEGKILGLIAKPSEVGQKVHELGRNTVLVN
jgi:hypothetical protein